MVPYLLSKLTRIPYLDVQIDKDPCLDDQIVKDPYLYYVQINEDSLPGCLQILSLNVVSSGAMVQQPGLVTYQVGNRPIIPGYNVQLSSRHGLVLIHLKVAFI